MSSGTGAGTHEHPLPSPGAGYEGLLGDRKMASMDYLMDVLIRLQQRPHITEMHRVQARALTRLIADYQLRRVEELLQRTLPTEGHVS